MRTVEFRIVKSNLTSHIKSVIVALLPYVPNIHSRRTYRSYNIHQNHFRNCLFHFAPPNHPVFSRTSLSIPRNGDPASNVTEESDLQSAKQFAPQTSTDERTIISIKPVSQNTHRSIRDNLDSDSNRIDQSNRQCEKHLSPKTLTDAGRIISTKPVSQNVSPFNFGQSRP
jgi:hypothetical protein